MKCRKHPEDYSSSSGVCASCLRQRLFALIEAQSQAAEGNHFKEDERESDANRIFPMSVSPHRRKSETAPVTGEIRRNDYCLPDRKFFSTPQIGPQRKKNIDDVDDGDSRKRRKAARKFWPFSSFFRSKSAITITDSDPRASESSENHDRETTSRTWFSRKKQLRTCSIDESTVKNHRINHRGMSPANTCSDDESVSNTCNINSGASTGDFKQTPRRTPGRHGGGRRSNLSRNVSDIVFCLSPLVRPSPNRIWNQKGGGLPPEIGVSGEARVPAKNHNLFCKNRSRKLADFGRCKINR